MDESRTLISDTENPVERPCKQARVTGPSSFEAEPESMEDESVLESLKNQVFSNDVVSLKCFNA